MAKRKKIPAELKEEWARNMRFLEERIAYHRDKAAAERPGQTGKPQP